MYTVRIDINKNDWYLVNLTKEKDAQACLCILDELTNRGFLTGVIDADSHHFTGCKCVDKKAIVCHFDRPGHTDKNAYFIESD